MKVSPCKDCTDRYEACHDYCGRYRAWKMMKNGESEALKDCKSTTRKIGGKRRKVEYNRTGVWKQT